MIDITELQRRLDSARMNHARAEAAYEIAVQDRDKILVALKTEFGLDNLADARAMVEDLKLQRDSELQKVINILDEIE